MRPVNSRTVGSWHLRRYVVKEQKGARFALYLTLRYVGDGSLGDHGSKTVLISMSSMGIFPLARLYSIPRKSAALRSVKVFFPAPVLPKVPTLLCRSSRRAGLDKVLRLMSFKAGGRSSLYSVE